MEKNIFLFISIQIQAQRAYLRMEHGDEPCDENTK